MRLYEGVAGTGFVLTETYKATQGDKYRQAAVRCVHWIAEHALTRGRGVDWGDATDIISGSAGTGLFLLYADRELKMSRAKELAAAAGRRLIELGRLENGRLKWPMSPSYPSLMPNFSHGTAGIAYFLATLYQETKSREFLDAALAGGRYLQSIAETEGETCLIFHDEPGAKNLFYLGWCHGPAGTGRLFYRLYQATGDSSWRTWFERCARTLVRSGIPEIQTPGSGITSASAAGQPELPISASMPVASPGTPDPPGGLGRRRKFSMYDKATRSSWAFPVPCRG